MCPAAGTQARGRAGRCADTDVLALCFQGSFTGGAPGKYVLPFSDVPMPRGHLYQHGCCRSVRFPQALHGHRAGIALPPPCYPAAAAAQLTETQHCFQISLPPSRPFCAVNKLCSRTVWWQRSPAAPGAADAALLCVAKAKQGLNSGGGKSGDDSVCGCSGRRLG